MLPPVILTKLGFDQVPSGDFTDSRPWPRRPPSTSPTLSVSGTMMIARASSSSLSGIAASGIACTSLSTRTAFCARASSSGPAIALPATSEKASIETSSALRSRVWRGRGGMDSDIVGSGKASGTARRGDGSG